LEADTLLQFTDRRHQALVGGPELLSWTLKMRQEVKVEPCA
jgi:hypothetical protein